MSASDEWADWVLTPDGWRVAKRRLDFGTEVELSVPPGAVKRVRFRQRMSSAFSKIEETHVTEWVGDPEAVAQLESKFGPCPSNFFDETDPQ